MAKDYYKILGVSKNASVEEIKKAFRKLAHEHHPDKEGGNETKFKEALQAYQVLSNAEKRQQYDQYGTNFDQAGAGGFGGFSGQDFGGFQGFDFQHFEQEFPDLSDIIGGMFGGGRGRSQRGARGHDIEKDISMTFKESVFGATKNVEIYAQVVCAKCDGHGAEPGSKIITCSVCGGSGQVQKDQRTIFGVFRTRVACEACGGDGKKAEKECKKCGGVGVTRDLKKLEVKIPAGVDDGGVVRLTGEGEAAPRGGRAGDLYLRIRVKPDPNFERRGQNIFSKISLKFTIAALGGKVEVETVDGPVELKISAGTQTNTPFRLRGKGVPSIHGNVRGDQIVEVVVEVPKKLSRQQKKLLEEFDEA